MKLNKAGFSPIKSGFTLIELLVVIGVFTILASIVLIAVNPAEQLRKSQDINTKTAASDFVTSASQYFAAKKLFPWQVNSTCLSEVNRGGLLSTMTNCLSEVTGGGQLPASFATSSELQQIYLTKCAETAVLCYNPQSVSDNKNPDTKFSQSGVAQPTCPDASGQSRSCYWCRGILPSSQCDQLLIPTPTPNGGGGPPPTPTPTFIPPQYGQADTRLFDTYDVFAFDDPGVPAPWFIDVSHQSDFGGTIHSINDPGNGGNADTFLDFAYVGDGNMGSVGSPSNNALRAITQKFIGFAPTPNITWGNYQQCGQTLFWRVKSVSNESLVGPTNSNVVDCYTIVGVISPPLNWYDVFDVVSNTQKSYNPTWDANNNNVIDWSDFVLLSLNTKFRSGGWQPPEISSPTTPTPTPTITPTPPPGSTPTPTPTPIGGIPTNTPTPIPTPTPTPGGINCGTTQTVSLTTTNTVTVNPGGSTNNTLNIRSNDSPTCSAPYTISVGYPTGWNVTGLPTSFTLSGGNTNALGFTVSLPANQPAGTYVYQIWVAKQGQVSSNPVNGTITVPQVGQPTPTPGPSSCTGAPTITLANNSLTGNAGDSLSESITIANTNPSSCSGASYGISFAEPSGYTINNLPASVFLSGGQSTTKAFTITISTGAQIGDNLLQFWINGGNPYDVTVHVAATTTPPPTQMFSNASAKTYKDYALFQFSYNLYGTGDFRLDVATDQNLLSQTSGSNPNVYYGFSSTPGNAMDPSNSATPTSIRGFIMNNPSVWSKWTCGQTFYWKMYNNGDLRIASPIQTGTVDCTTVVNVLPWDPWYAAIYQGIYDNRYDANSDGRVDWTDYWILVQQTRLR